MVTVSDTQILEATRFLLERAKLVERPQLIPNAVEEILRFLSQPVR